MKTKRTDAKYSEIFNELKDEKMNWDFDDFLAAAEKSHKITPLLTPRKSPTPKIFWMAASVAALVASGILFNPFKKTSVTENDALVKNEILKQKDEFGNGTEPGLLSATDSVKTTSDSLVSDSASIRNADDIVDQILPKRGRIRRQVAPRYVQNPKAGKTATPEKAPEYHSNYVIINGQKIENEQEAIDLTKYSFRVLSDNVSKTVAQTDVINFNNDF